MKIKQIMFVTLMLIAILTLGAASAADDVAINETQDTVVSSADTDIIADGDDDNYDDENYDDETEELDYYIDIDSSYYIDDYDGTLIYYDFSSEDANGNLSIYMDNKELRTYSINGSTGNFISANDLGLKNLTFKEYTLNAVYSGDAKYGDFNETLKFTGSWRYFVSIADKYSLEWEGNYRYGQEIGFVISTDNARGTVECYVNGKKYKNMTTDELKSTHYEDDYEMNFIIEGDAFIPDSNHVEFKYVGNDYPETIKKFDLDLVPTIRYSKNVLAYDETMNFILKLPEDAKGDLNIYIINVTDGDYWEGIPGEITSYQLIGSSPVINGIGNVTIPCPAIGTYYIYGNYSGSDYKATLGDFDYEYWGFPLKFQIIPKIEIPSKIFMENKYNISITLPETYNGIFQVYINEKGKTVNVSKGKASIELFNYESNDEDYFYVDYYYDDDDYSYSSSKYVEKSYINPEFELNIHPKDTLKGDKEYYYSYKNLPSDIEGNVNIYIDGKFAVSSHVRDAGPINLSGMEMGEHTIKVDYLGDGYYLPTSASGKFNITDVVIDIDDEAIIGTYPEFGTENYCIYIDTIYDGGYYALTIDGKLVDIETMDFSEIIFINNLTYGKHEIEVTYKNDKVEKSKKQTVNARYAIINYRIPGDNEDFYAPKTFTFTLPSEVTGNLIVSVDKDYTVKIVDGIATLTIDHLDGGRYTTKTRYDGDEYPEFTQTYEPFKVDPIFGPDHTLIKGPQKDTFEYGESITITADFSPDTNAKLLVYEYIDHQIIEYGKVQLVNGKAEITISNLTYGRHEIIGTLTDFDNDEDYEIFDNDLEETYFVKPSVNGTVDYFYETITFGQTVSLDIEFASDANGIAYIYIDGKDPKTIGQFKLTNGKATATIDKYYLGSNSLYIRYDDDKYHYDGEALQLTVYPNITYPESMGVGSDEYLIMTMPEDANGDLEVFGMKATLKNGTAKIPLSNLKIDVYQIDLLYKNDETYGIFNYIAYEGWLYSKYLYVTKPVADIKVTKTDDNLKVMINDDATGFVVVKVADEFYPELLVNGSATIKVQNMTSSENITVSYTGNEKYNVLHKKSVKVEEIIRQDANLSVEVKDINVGDIAAIRIELNENATGDILIQIDGRNITVAILNGMTNATVPDLKAGTYNVTAVYSGDENVLGDVKTATFTVSKVPYDDNSTNPFEDNETKDSKNPTYSINLPADATGNLTVTIANKTYTKELVNGSASIEVTDLPVGEYDVTVSYTGDAKYAPITKTTKASVKVDPKIVAKDLTVQYYAGKYYSVTVYGDDAKPAANEKVTFTLNGKKITTVTTNENGTAKFKVTQTPVTKGKLVIEALGIKVTKKLTVKRVIVLKSVTVKKSAKKLVLQATLKKVNGKYLKGKKITFKFNGKTYKAKTDKKGVAKVTIKSNVLKKLKVGKKVTYQATYVKDTVKKTVKVKR